MTPAVRHHNAVNLLRALAVIAVVAHHMQHYLHTPIPYLGEVGGQLGVQLFFLISGYLIVQTAARQSWWHFLALRAFRIFPAYWAALLAVSIWPSGTVPLANPADWPYFVVNALTLSHIVPYAMARFDVLTVSWTLTIEWTWYLLAPLLILGERAAVRWRTPAVRYWLLCTLLAWVISSLWILAARAGHFDFLYAPSMAHMGVDPITDGLRTAFIVVAAPAQWGFFLVGVLLWVCRDALAGIPRWACWLAAVALLAKPSLWPLLIATDPNPITALGLAALFLAVGRWSATTGSTAAAQAWWAPILRALHGLGDISYPVYLLHVPAIVIAQVHLQLSGALAALAGIALTVLAAIALHQLVENPARALGARLLRSR